MTKICSFLQINENSLNPFKCSEMILNYKGKMIDEVMTKCLGETSCRACTRMRFQCGPGLRWFLIPETGNVSDSLILTVVLFAYYNPGDAGRLMENFVTE